MAVERGEPLNLPDDTLRALSQVGPEDVPEAEAFAFDAAGIKAVDLIRAEEDE